MKSLYLLLAGFILCSCDSQRVLLRSGSKSVIEYEIGQYNSGCCGCVALYYSIYVDQQIKEQLIFEATCGIGKPTVYQFEERDSKKMKEVKRYVAVSDGSTEIKFDSKQRLLLGKLDSIASSLNIKIVPKGFQFSNLVGFRPGVTGEEFHPFWINEKGKSVYQGN
jgi:hypothetical protein